MAIFKCEGKKHFSHSETLSYKYVKHDWMEKIEDNKLLSAISIPGTHQSNKYLKTSTPMFQAWGLHNQLDAGIRFFEMHVSSDSIKYIKTGSVQETETLIYVLKTLLTFLVKQKKEMVLLRVTPDEGAVAQVTNELSRPKWPLWRDKEIPTIGQVRGKIVLIQSSTLQLGLPVHIKELDANMDTKETQMRQNIKSASEECDHELRLTYTGAKGESEEPLEIAKTLNKQVDDYLLDLKGGANRPHCVGIIAMDFPGPKVIQTIIDFNGKLGEGSQIVGDMGSNEDVALPDSSSSGEQQDKSHSTGGEHQSESGEHHASQEESAKHQSESGEHHASQEESAKHQSESGEHHASRDESAKHQSESGEHHASGHESAKHLSESGEHHVSGHESAKHDSESGEHHASQEESAKHHSESGEHHASGHESAKHHSESGEHHASQEESAKHQSESGEHHASQEESAKHQSESGEHHASQEESAKHHSESGEHHASQEESAKHHSESGEHHASGNESAKHQSESGEHHASRDESQSSDDKHHTQDDQHDKDATSTISRKKFIIKKVHCHKVHARPRPSPLLY
ncbi:hypothetical protein DPX16_4778 [Anabarilius grahami]|uniref:Uncharacterized protein n=1 Tax=Anabarilius grahami TaxID=495550 RepID=A0A3N0YIL1_ANAGA|nr:hypothetical protein DPX16_4778 [Anabarilius grahami]